MISQRFFVSLFILAFGLVYFFSGTSTVTSPTVLEANASEAVTAPSVSGIASLPEKNINALAAFSVRVEDGGIIFNQGAQKKLPVASLTKLMTALVVLEDYDLGKEVTITPSVMGQEGEQGELQIGQTFSVKNLLYITLVESSNRAAYALAQVIGVDNFVARMNEKAQVLGLVNTHFADNTGLGSGSYSTAQDIAILSAHLLVNYPLFGEMIALKEANLYWSDGRLHHKLINTNQLLGQAGVVGGKTGWTSQARGCFMVIQQRDTGYIIHVILGAEDRFGEMQKLINTT